jgi:hypothetical protein
MAGFFTHATTLATTTVLVVLVAGLWNMMRAGSPHLGQKLMRWRVGLQLLAIVVIMATVLVKRA